MSETTENTDGRHSIAHALARTRAHGHDDATAEPTAHEAYSFACLHCGHGWEQAYDIEHHVDALGQPYVSYHADGERVPSPLTKPSCRNCGAHVLRIMRSGQVSLASNAMSYGRPPRQRTGDAGAGRPGASGGTGGAGRAAGTEPAAGPPTGGHGHHWNLGDLWPFHRK